MLYLAFLGLLTVGGIGYVGWRRLGSRPAAWWALIGIITSVALILRPTFTAHELRALQRDLPNYADLTTDKVGLNLPYSRAILNPNPGCDEYSISFVKHQGTWTVEAGRSRTKACGLQ